MLTLFKSPASDSWHLLMWQLLPLLICSSRAAWPRLSAKLASWNCIYKPRDELPETSFKGRPVASATGLVSATEKVASPKGTPSQRSSCPHRCIHMKIDVQVIDIESDRCACVCVRETEMGCIHSGWLVGYLRSHYNSCCISLYLMKPFFVKCYCGLNNHIVFLKLLKPYLTGFIF